MVFCGYCGTENPEDFNYCSDCVKLLSKKLKEYEKSGEMQKENSFKNRIFVILKNL